MDVPLAHLDRPFDYLVPDTLDSDARPGVRVRVRFAGRLLDGVVLARLDRSAHDGRLGWLERVVSPEPVLSDELARLCRVIADRQAGTFADVLRLAVPPRHARVEAETPVPAPDPPPPGGPYRGWERYQHGPALLAAVADGRSAHAVWHPLPGEDWPARVAEVVATAAAAGRGALVVVPDQRDVARVLAAAQALVGPERVAALTADLGPARRYRTWLAVRRGLVKLVVGTRAAAFAPVADLGLLVIWDDGDDLHAEPRAPYPHARDVLVQRAYLSGAALLVAGFARTAESALLVGSGWAREVVAARDEVRTAMPRIAAVGDSESALARDPLAHGARLPAVAFDVARAALARDEPVLVQVPRAGYIPGLACASCREPARCRACAGPLGLPSGSGRTGDVFGGGHNTVAASLRCRWCGVPEAAYRCPACGSRRPRATVFGAGRTGEELGRAFPGATVRASGGGAPVLAEVPAGPALVVATPGAEPWVAGAGGGAGGGAGYGAALLLDGWALLGRPDLRVAEETLRRWLAAAALVRPHAHGGRVVVAAEPELAVVQALVRWDPAGHAHAELIARTEVGFPPAVRMAAVDGSPDAVADLLRAARLPDDAEVLGPVELAPTAAGEPRERALLRVPTGCARELSAALAAAQATRSARKATDLVRVRLDPQEIS
ncbi:MAG: hypothetical protein QOI54_2877 [Actinomycetota bacterium]|nr:hypothetical protein [Actinomycetota bacterium]